MSFVNEKLQDFSYYESKLPMWLQQTTNFKEHFRIWFDVLTSEIGFGGALLQSLQIFENIELNSDVLEKLAALFDYQRSFTVSYLDDEDQPVIRQITLTDKELALLIKCQIIKNYFDGSRETIEQFYKSTGIAMYYKNYASRQVACYLQYDEDTPSLSQNVLDMFYAGLLTIESVGISYIKSLLDIKMILRWVEDESDAKSYEMWDKGRWSV